MPFRALSSETVRLSSVPTTTDITRLHEGSLYAAHSQYGLTPLADLRVPYTGLHRHPGYAKLSSGCFYLLK